MIINLVNGIDREPPKKEVKRMGALVWYEIIGIWGFAALVIVTDQKNWRK
jgi:hypothetical protein